jgi:hypothetical protein
MGYVTSVGGSDHVSRKNPVEVFNQACSRACVYAHIFRLYVYIIMLISVSYDYYHGGSTTPPSLHSHQIHMTLSQNTHDTILT